MLLYLFCRWRTEAHRDGSRSQTAFLAHLLTPILLELHKPNQVKNEQGARDDALMTKHGGCFKDLSSHRGRPTVSLKAPRICLYALRLFMLKYFTKQKKNQLRKISQMRDAVRKPLKAVSPTLWQVCLGYKAVSHWVLLLSLKMFKECQLCVCISSMYGLEWVLVQMGLVWNEVFYASFGINPQV